MTRSVFFLSWKDQELASVARDCYLTAVVVADDENSARTLMQARTADEGLFALNPKWRELMWSQEARPAFRALLEEFARTREQSKFWVSDEFSTCQVIGTAAADAPNGIVCVSFASG